MLTNFFKITLRNLARNKVYTFISVLGLALGISSCVLIALYVADELSYDNFHEKGDRIYRLHTITDFNGEMVTAMTNFGAGPTMTQDYPEVENYVRFRGTGSVINMSIDQQVFNEPNVWLADSTIFDVFSFDVIAGDPKKALTQPKSLVLTRSLKEKFFGDEEAIGKEVKINNTVVTVTAVMADPPKNSDITINALLPMTIMPQSAIDNFNQDWFRIGFYTFLLFQSAPDVDAFEQKLVEFEKKYVQPWSAENQIVAGQEYYITGLEEVHFQQGLDHDLPKGNMNYILTFSLLALFILIIASINYINLSLAQGARRAKEVGVRKTLGALRKELIGQFMGESILITLFAMILGLALVELLMGNFNNLTGKFFDITSVFQPALILTLLGIVVLVGALAGSYPAVVLSSFHPVRVLKGASPKEGGVGRMQKTLIMLQFVFSLFMITSTILVDDQMDFMRSMNLGFDKENVMVISLPSDTNVGKRIPSWVEELRKDPAIKSVAHTNVPTGNTGELMFRVEQDGQLKEQGIKFFFVDEYFIDVLGLELKKGRNFNPEIATDQQQAFIINEYAAQHFGWGDSALGKRVQWGLMANNQASNDGVVVGVVNNFHFLSLHNPMEPFILCYIPGGNNMLTLRFAEGDYTHTIARLEEQWSELAPNNVFNYNFLDDLLDRNYQQEQAMSQIFSYFAIISILIASLGLFALLSFSIQSRVKEIGIRKVLGASVVNISWILVRDFFYLLLAAFVVVTPVCIYLMNRWLEGFAFDVPINPLSFVLALVMAVVLAALTISYHVFRISRTDPVESLRYE